jgi:hypothetical protein
MSGRPASQARLWIRPKGSPRWRVVALAIPPPISGRGRVPRPFSRGAGTGRVLARARLPRRRLDRSQADRQPSGGGSGPTLGPKGRRAARLPRVKPDQLRLSTEPEGVPCDDLPPTTPLSRASCVDSRSSKTTSGWSGAATCWRTRWSRSSRAAPSHRTRGGTPAACSPPALPTIAHSSYTTFWDLTVPRGGSRICRNWLGA